MSEYGVVTEPRTIRMERPCRGRSSAFGNISPTQPSEANGSRTARWTFASVEISNSSSTTPISQRRRRAGEAQEQSEWREHAWHCRRLRASAPFDIQIR